MSLMLKFDVNDKATPEIKKLREQLNQLKPSISGAEKSMGGLNSTMIKAAGAFYGMSKAFDLTKSFVETADSMKLLDSRLRLVTGSIEEYRREQKELLKISRDTFSSISDITTLYTKLDPALRQLGANTAAVNRVTESFSKGLKLGGASVNEAAAATLQFAQAMGSGVLRGDEFNSMAEASPKLMAYMAKGMGVPKTALREMAAEGKLTAEVVAKALLKMSSEIDGDFKTLPNTVGYAVTNIGTSLKLLVQDVDDSIGVTDSLATAIKDLDESISTYAPNIIGAFGDIKVIVGDVSGVVVDLSSDVIDLANSMGLSSKSGGGLSLFQDALLGISVITNTMYVGIHNVIAILEELNKSGFKAGGNIFANIVSASKIDMSELNKNILTTDDILKGIEKTYLKLGAAEKEYVKQSLERNKIKKDSATAEIGGGRTKLTEEQIKATEKLRKEQEKLSEENQKVRESFISLTGTEYDAWLVDTNNKMIELSKNGVLSAEELAQAWDNLELTAPDISEFDAHVKMFYENQKTLQEQATALMTSDIDKINAKYLEMYDAVQGIFDDEQMQKFFSTWNKEISKATKEQKSYEGIGSDEWTQGLRGQAKDLSNVGKAFKSISKEQEEFNKYSKENNVTEKDKGKHLENQISLFGNLAGAMSNLAEDGSQSAKVLQTAQAALSLTSLALGVAEQSKLPFPYNIAAMASTLATGISILSSLGVSGGGGGGSSSPDYAAIEKQNVENRQTDLDNQYEPLLEKFDTQISLLEKIEKNGSASKYSISQARTQYEYDISTYANQIGDVVGGYREVDYSKNNQTAMTNTANAFLDFSKSIKEFGIDATGIVASLHYAHKTVGYELSTVLNTKSDLLAYVANRDKVEALYDVARTKISTEVNAPKADIATDAEFEKIKIEVGTFIGEFALAIGDSIEQMKDMSLEFQDIFDSLTNTMTYSNKRLSEAQSEVNALLEGQDFSSYLKNQIDLISEVERKYGMTIDMFLSSDDIALQAQAVIEMERITGIAFDGGAEAALNYLDSINLVAEAMINSNENIKEWNDGFKTNQELAQQMADVLNVSLATSMEELNSLFNKLSTDAEGLTDAELELLNANKSLLEVFGEIAAVITDNINKQSQLNQIYSLTHTDLENETYLRQQAIDGMGKEDAARQIQINKLLDAKSALDILNASLSAISTQSTSYTSRLNELLAVDKEAYKREVELSGALNNTNASILKAIYAVEDKQAKLAALAALTESINNEIYSLQDRLEMTGALTDADKLAITRQRELDAALSSSAKSFLNQIYAIEDQIAINQEMESAIESFTNTMSGMIDSIDDAINSIKGNMMESDEFTTDQIKRLNMTQMAFESAISGGDSEKASSLLGEITSLSTGISSGAFGDTSKINANLVSSLEANKAMIDFTDEVLMVRIVASDLDYEQTVSTTTPSVYVTNSTNNDDRLATLEAIMTEVLKTNKNVYNVLLQIQNDGVKTI